MLHVAFVLILGTCCKLSDAHIADAVFAKSLAALELIKHPLLLLCGDYASTRWPLVHFYFTESPLTLGFFFFAESMQVGWNLRVILSLKLSLLLLSLLISLLVFTECTLSLLDTFDVLLNEMLGIISTFLVLLNQIAAFKIN